MPNFTVDYLVYDEFGLRQVLCMVCGKAIKSRSELRSELDPKLIIRELSKHPEYREIPVVLSDGKLAFIMVCDDDKFVPIRDEDAGNLSMQIKNGLKKQLEQEGKLPELVDAILKERNYTVTRKAEVSEVTAALKGV